MAARGLFGAALTGTGTSTLSPLWILDKQRKSWDFPFDCRKNKGKV
jgi:hypothetical protein